VSSFPATLTHSDLTTTVVTIYRDDARSHYEGAMKPNEPLGPLELDVLRHTTDCGPVTVGEVAAHFASTSGQARTTVLTVMERLRNKGYLTRRKVKGVNRYVPTLSKTELLQRMVGTFVSDVLGGSVSPFVAWLTQSSDLSQDEVKKLSKLLESIESREAAPSQRGKDQK